MTGHSTGMRLAKASNEEALVATDVALIIENLHKGEHPGRGDDAPHYFNDEDPAHLRALYDRLIELTKEHPGGLFRAAGLAHVVLTNDILDPADDCVALHPKFVDATKMGEQQWAAWRVPDELPDVARGEYSHFWVAIRREGRVASYPAVYLNAMPLNRDDLDPIEHAETGNRWRNDPPGEDDECTMLASGWHDSREHSEYDGYYSPLLEKGAELLGWREVAPWPHTDRPQPVAAGALHEIVSDIRQSAKVDDYEIQQIAFLESIADRLAALTAAPAAPAAVAGDARDRVMGELEQWFDTQGVDVGSAADSVIAALAHDRASQARAAGYVPAAFELNEQTREILGRPMFACIGIAQTLRQRGDEIAKKAEHEQAAVLAFCLGHYFTSGAAWRDAAEAELRDIAAAAPTPAAEREAP